MKAQWTDKNGVVHIIPWSEITYGATWCKTVIAIEEEELLDVAPTCVACIGQVARYYSLLNIKGLHVRRA